MTQNMRKNGDLTGKPPAKKTTVLKVLGGGALALLAVGIGWTYMAKESQATDITVYKSPYCGCCGHWISYLKENGFTVVVENVKDMDSVKKRLGVPEKLASCHTGVMGEYIVEGHVPVEDLRRLLHEKPSVKGISVPGMPMGSPGMEIPGEKPDRYNVLTYTQDGKTQIFAHH